MAEPSRRSLYSMEEAVETCLRRDSDHSGDEISEEDSEMSFDSEAEEMFLEGGDFILDKPSSYSYWQCPLQEKKESTSLEEEPHSPTPQRSGGRGRSKQAGSSTPEEGWNDIDVPDVTPPQPTFRPNRALGPQLNPTATYTALQLFQRFFATSILQQIVRNTNEFGAARHTTPSNPWIAMTLEDMFSFMSLVVYFGLVKCSAFTDYWRGGKLYSMPFPKKVMTGKKFLRISRTLHLSSVAADAANEQKRGTPAFDRLASIKPLYEEIREACRRHFHPGQDISIGERMVASKAHMAFKQYMKNKPVPWGYKLFVLADSRNGYTWDFFTYEGKLQGKTGNGLSYNSVMELIDTQLLGTGYKLYVDNFYTSPTLFTDLLQMKIWACGPVRTNRIGFPKTNENRLVPESARGSIRWIRKDSLLFVQWRDTKDVFMCSTFHTAHAKDSIPRRLKDAAGHWAVTDIPIPPAVKEYNRCMGGVDLSNSLIGYYKVLHKTMKWYKTFFYHFMDIAIVNAFLLHKDVAKGNGEVPMSQKAFRETLAEQLAEAGSPSTATPAPPPAPHGPHHKPVYITGSSTAGRLKCHQCHKKTPLKCSSCDVALCLIPTRDCYNEWHTANDM
ncbi:piggyBac transposable element-derived protein 4 [Cyclopterus lumpus]|uniref:PiggyBac transposable element-derived protein domain-containing protein n=1 Tax=Cyclopterus lumpus TaxID=8103 RepID=A0A8C3A964_CYCLU|nr:piggyBac transposable element-derived protein 4 [Cyclopterus lumpus]